MPRRKEIRLLMESAYGQLDRPRPLRLGLRTSSGSMELGTVLFFVNWKIGDVDFGVVAVRVLSIFQHGIIHWAKLECDRPLF